MYLMNIHVVGVRLAKQRMTVLTCGGVEQSGKNERINTIKKYKQRNQQKSITLKLMFSSVCLL